MPFTSGLQIGPYRVMEQLGQGGMATVYQAYHASLDRYVALKVLHQAFMEDSNFLARFQREARLVARLEHPNIVPIYDYAEYEGQPYLVMKFIEGETLKARLQRGPLNATEVQNVVDAVGAALAYAHKQGILHRDIKPSNVILAKDGNIFLADFGLARIAQSGESTLTTDMVLGTPQYISPEQAMAKKDLDEGTDIYSFGVMLYEMTVGRVPFSADTPFSVIHDHIYAPLPLPSTVNPKVSADLERVLLKALSKERADRYADIPAFVDAFKNAWSTSASTLAVSMPGAAPDAVTIPPVSSQPSSPMTMPVMAAAIPEAESTPPVPAAEVVEPDQRPRKRKSPSRWMWIAILLGSCLCCAVAFFALRTRNNFSAAATPPSAKDMQATVVAAIPPKIGPTVQVAIQTAMPQPPTPQRQPVTPQPQDLPPADKIDLVPIDLAVAKRNVDKNPNDPGAHLDYGFSLLQNKVTRDGYLEIRRSAELGAKHPVFLNEAARALDKANLPLGAAFMYLQMGSQLRGNGQVIDSALLINLRRTIYYGFAEPVAPEVLDYGTIEKVHPPLSLVAQARNAILYGKDPGLAIKLIEELRNLSKGMPEPDLLQAELLIFTKQDIPGAQKLLAGILQMPRVPDWITARAKELQQMTK
jgi:serine/threonine protein kinase